MQPIYISHQIDLPKEVVKYTYPVPQELQEEIKRKMKAFSDGYSVSIENIQIKLTKPNDT